LARANQVFRDCKLLGKDSIKGRNLDKSLDQQLSLFKKKDEPEKKSKMWSEEDINI
jgi:hypothetical protein